MKNHRITLLISIIVLSLTFVACTKDNKPIKGEGAVVTQSFELPTINGVYLDIDARVVLAEGDEQEVIIEAQQNIIDNIEKYVSNGIWNISSFNPVRSHAAITIYITTPLVNYATISGSGLIETTNAFNDSTSVYLSISGSGSISMNTNAHIVESEISGSGGIYLGGSAYEQRIFISGSGNVEAFDFITQNTYVRISGSGNCKVYAEEYLDVSISGSGNVFYLGNPQINVDISGSGGLINSN